MTRRTPENPTSNPNKKESKLRRNLAIGLIGAGALTMTGCGNSEGEIIAAPTGGMEQPEQPEQPQENGKFEITEEQYNEALSSGVATPETTAEKTTKTAEMQDSIFGESSVVQMEGVPEVTGYNETEAALNERAVTLNAEYAATLTEKVNSISLYNHFDNKEQFLTEIKDLYLDDFAIASRIENKPYEDFKKAVENDSGDITDQESFSFYATYKFAENISSTAVMADKLDLTDPEENLWPVYQAVTGKLLNEAATGARSTDTITIRNVPDEELPAEAQGSLIVEGLLNQQNMDTSPENGVVGGFKNIVEITSADGTAYAVIDGEVTGKEGQPLTVTSAKVSSYELESYM